MSKINPRIYLFHGTDSLTSGEKLSSWLKLFTQKHPEGVRSVLDVDDATPEEMVMKLSQVISSTGLFEADRIVVLKRMTKYENGRTQPYSKSFIKLVESNSGFIDQTITLVIWEEQLLADSHSLLRQFKIWEKTGFGKEHSFLTPSRLNVIKVIDSRLSEEHLAMSVQAKNYLLDQFIKYEKNIRVIQGLKYNQEIVKDDRVWWLKNVTDSCILLARDGQISLSLIQEIVGEIVGSITVFDFIRAIDSGSVGVAKKMLGQYDQQSIGGDQYFGLYGAMRWNWQSKVQKGIDKELSGYGLGLLGEVEILVKNGIIPHVWIVDLLIDRISEFKKSQKKHSLIDLRTLWLSGLPKS